MFTVTFLCIYYLFDEIVIMFSENKFTMGGKDYLGADQRKTRDSNPEEKEIKVSF